MYVFSIIVCAKFNLKLVLWGHFRPNCVCVFIKLCPGNSLAPGQSARSCSLSTSRPLLAPKHGPCPLYWQTFRPAPDRSIWTKRTKCYPFFLWNLLPKRFCTLENFKNTKYYNRRLIHRDYPCSVFIKYNVSVFISWSCGHWFCILGWCISIWSLSWNQSDCKILTKKKTTQQKGF